VPVPGFAPYAAPDSYRSTVAFITGIAASTPSAGYATIYTAQTMIIAWGQTVKIETGTSWDGFYSVASLGGNGGLTPPLSINPGVSIVVSTGNNYPTASGRMFNYASIQVQSAGADGFGNFYFPDLNTNAIWMINGSNNCRMLVAGGTGGAGGPADGACALAGFNSPRGVAVSTDGLTIYVADLGNQRVRKITRSSWVTNAGCSVTTQGGGGAAGFADGQGAAASFNNMREIGFDVTGNVVVADYSNHAIRRVSVGGYVSTVAGTGSAGYKDGTGTSAWFQLPRSVTVLQNGDIYVADW
jgi:hypothetical protein